MNFFFKGILCSALITLSIKSYGQQYVVMQDASGQVVSEHNYIDIEGSPYLGTEWFKGNLILANHKTYKDIDLKYDEVKDKVFTKGVNNELIALVDQVTEFSLKYPIMGETTSRTFRLGYPNIAGTTAASYFEVLADGKTQLLKRSVKVVRENKEYNSATITRSFEESIKYYLFSNGNGTLVKNDKKSVLAVLASKQEELERYSKDNKLNLKTDADFTKLIVYYNTLND